jgi:hypothetical protein
VELVQSLFDLAAAQARDGATSAIGLTVDQIASKEVSFCTKVRGELQKTRITTAI